MNNHAYLSLFLLVLVLIEIEGENIYIYYIYFILLYPCITYPYEISNEIERFEKGYNEIL